MVLNFPHAFAIQEAKRSRTDSWIPSTGRGLAEIPRYLLSIAGVEFEDYRYPITAEFKRPV